MKENINLRAELVYLNARNFTKKRYYGAVWNNEMLETIVPTSIRLGGKVIPIVSEANYV